jgi:hypothetical protein
MAQLKKLQSEIDKGLKKVDEGPVDPVAQIRMTDQI